MIVTFLDPDGEAITGLGLTRLPALVHLAADGAVAGASEGWKPDEWQRIVDQLAKVMHWTSPVVPSAL